MARMTLEAIRISGTRRGSEGVAGRGVSQRSGHGGFGHEGKKSRGVRGREQGGKGADEGVPGGCRGILSRSGAGRQAGGGSGACVRAAATRSSFCPRTKTTGEGSGDGLGRLGGNWAGWWAARVAPGKSFSVFYFYFSYCFLFSVIVFGFIKNARAFPKIMQLTVATVWNISSSKHFSL